ncbi:MAG: hypothetical protein JWQ34_321 [Mucilaginibacter sp.]|uniref:hypothetical protein n=1 Tax=Mucilaginibacter sp. TaxID=1882438 RepID=UPI00261BD0C1|nr:hypothetical protein [Mucilaginibacter sp.]MDB5002096.1 hypothetical protein [Mucilaginibacter sp.]
MTEVSTQKLTGQVIGGKKEGGGMDKVKVYKDHNSARQIINATLSLDLSYIQKHAPIKKKPYATHGVLITDTGTRISYESNYGNEEHYSLEINYSVSYERSYQLTVGLLEVSSNLGKGCLLYLSAP